MSQAHSKAIWSESSAAGTGAVVDVIPMYLVYSGLDVVPSATGPEQLAFFKTAPGVYTLFDLGSAPPGVDRLFLVRMAGNLYLY